MKNESVNIEQKKSSDVVWSEVNVTKDRRDNLNKQRSAIIWFTGLSGSGKTTIANALEQRLHKEAFRTYLLDGDNVRHGLSNDLGFSDNDRTENIRRIGEVSKLFIDAGVMVLATFISPFLKDRKCVRNIVNETEFIEIYIKCPLDLCENRDVKGLYKKARAGEIKHFTGIDSPYEAPESAEIIIDTSLLTIDESVDAIINYLIKNAYLVINRRQRFTQLLLNRLTTSNETI
ncbi:MAG: adenylyl-sulfate kinase [Gammaproteobacteria bacterium]|nr:adenylyl-sulfate kinase [Gammaproteobacteria bacterium]